MQPGAKHSLAEPRLAGTELHTAQVLLLLLKALHRHEEDHDFAHHLQGDASSQKAELGSSLLSVPPSSYTGWAGGEPSVCSDSRSGLQFQLLLQEICIRSTFIIWPHFDISEILKVKIAFYYPVLTGQCEMPFLTLQPF